MVCATEYPVGFGLRSLRLALNVQAKTRSCEERRWQRLRCNGADCCEEEATEAAKPCRNCPNTRRGSTERRTYVREGLSEIMPDFSNLRQRRPPETASSSSSRSSQPPRDRSDHTHNSSIFGGWWKQQAIFSLVAVAVWFVWSGTSVSDLCLDLLVAQVPRQADVELQVQALRQQPHAYYDAYWTPLVQEIGNDLVQTLVRTCRTSSNKLHKKPQGCPLSPSWPRHAGLAL